MKIIILSGPCLSLDTSGYDLVIRLDESFHNESDVLAFIPTRYIKSKSRQNICFIPYHTDIAQYKQNAKRIANEVGDDKFLLVNTDFTYSLQKSLKISSNENMNVLTFLVKMLLDNSSNDEIFLSNKIKLSNKEEKYLDKLIEDKKISMINND